MDRRRFLAVPLLLAGPRPRLEARLRFAAEEGRFRFLDDGRECLVYQHAPTSGPPGMPSLRPEVARRGGYFHPAHAPNGARVTDDFPPDHPHQRGIFFAWTRTRLRLGDAELQPDFWNLGSGTGRIRSVRVDARADTGQPLQLTAQHAWEARLPDGGWQEVLRETWEARLLLPRRVADAGGFDAEGAAWVLDLTVRQRPLVRIELPEYRYGGMAVRGAREWLRPESGFSVLTSEARGGDAGRLPTRQELDGTRARWAAMSGRVGEKLAGIALLEHPANPGAPNPWRVHPEVPYFVSAPPRAGGRVLEAGEELRLRYRIVLHNGRTAPERMEALWREFAETRA